MNGSEPGSHIRANPESAIAPLDDLISKSGLSSLSSASLDRFRTYLDLILKWNARTNLTAVRDANAIVERHFIECVACAQALPGEIRSLLDFGSGAGLPGIPIAICRPDVIVTLAESQNKKAAFLLEVVRQLRLNVRVFASRAERFVERFDCVILRAVDRMERAVSIAAHLIEPCGFLAVMTTVDAFATARQAAGSAFVWREPIYLPGSHQRVLLLGRRASGLERKMFHVEL